MRLEVDIMKRLSGHRHVVRAVLQVMVLQVMVWRAMRCVGVRVVLILGTCQVTLVDHLEDKANVYLVMEWCKGGDLMKYVYKCKHFSEKVASCLFQQMLLAVKHCHESGVVHRDLKPDNFLFASTEGRTHLKISDFGLSTIIDTPDQIITDVREHWTCCVCVCVCVCVVAQAGSFPHRETCAAVCVGYVQRNVCHY